MPAASEGVGLIVECRVCGASCQKRKTGARICPDCQRAYLKEYNLKNRDRLLEEKRAFQRRKRDDPEWAEQERKRGREYWSLKRHNAIEAYGGYKCACCGETEPTFLTIDHINNDGAEHRRDLASGEGGRSKQHLLVWLKNNGYPPGFQVLCFNCNIGKSINGGLCPHKRFQMKIA